LLPFNTIAQRQSRLLHPTGTTYFVDVTAYHAPSQVSVRKENNQQSFRRVLSLNVNVVFFDGYNCHYRLTDIAHKICDRNACSGAALGPITMISLLNKQKTPQNIQNELVPVGYNLRYKHPGANSITTTMIDPILVARCMRFIQEDVDSGGKVTNKSSTAHIKAIHHLVQAHDLRLRDDDAVIRRRYRQVYVAKDLTRVSLPILLQ
jgi:hypothetical protein